MTNKNKLNHDDVELIFEALAALEQKGGKDSLLATLIGVGTLPPFFREAFVDGQIRAREEEKGKEKLLTERIILLKAKLLSLRDQAEVEDLIEDELGGPG